MHPDCCAERRVFLRATGGWKAGNPEQTEQAFKYAFQNIKPSDGVIVGMMPAFSDQVSENAGHTINYGSAST